MVANARHRKNVVPLDDGRAIADDGVADDDGWLSPVGCNCTLNFVGYRVMLILPYIKLTLTYGKISLEVVHVVSHSKFRG